jgi:hypothetical protein
MTGRPRRDLSKQMEQAAARPSSSSVSPPRPAGPAPRTKPVRLSVDLAPTAYRELQEFCTAAAVALERPRVAGVDVLRSLLAELAEDEDLAERVQGRLAGD